MVNTVPVPDLLIIAGDWNARTGPADAPTGHILGKFGLGQRCENRATACQLRRSQSHVHLQHPFLTHLVIKRRDNGELDGLHSDPLTMVFVHRYL